MASVTVDGVVATMPKCSFDIAAPIDPTVFYPRFGPLPGVVAVHDQTGRWNAVGRTRTLELSDGGHVVETITDADSPNYFAYELSDFQKLFGRIVSGARSEWRFDRVETGTRIAWTYTFRAKPGASVIVGLIVKLFWGPYMRKVLPAILGEVERAAGALAASDGATSLS